MGACASKSKVLKAEGGEAPAPAPAPVQAKETVEAPALREEKKEVVEDGGVKEIVEDDAVDEEGSKRRSLSHLFKENEGKGSTENEKIQSEPTKQEPIEEFEAKLPDAEKFEAQVELQAPAPLVEAPQNSETEKVIESHIVPEARKDITPSLNTEEDKEIKAENINIEAHIVPEARKDVTLALNTEEDKETKTENINIEASMEEKTEAAKGAAPDAEDVKVVDEGSKSENGQESARLHVYSSVKIDVGAAGTK